jgi:hypothetical protein
VSIPAPTTQIQLLAPGTSSAPDDWGGASDSFVSVGDPVNAHLSYPSGYANAAQEGSTSGVEFQLVCDPCPIEADMQIRDLGTGAVYQVSWVLSRPSLLPHVLAGVRAVLATS